MYNADCRGDLPDLPSLEGPDCSGRDPRALRGTRTTDPLSREARATVRMTRQLCAEEVVADKLPETANRPAGELTIQELQELLERKRLALRGRRLGRIEEEEVKTRREHPDRKGRLPRRTPVNASRLSDEEFQERFGPWEHGSLRPGDAYRGAPAAGRGRRTWWDRLLLALEVLALVGLGIVVVMSLTSLRGLDHEIGEATSTMVPSPTASPVATLPGSSLSPRESHLPPFYQGLVQPANPVPLLTPTLGPQTAIRIVIDRIRVDAPVVEGDDWESLKKGVGHHTGSANPGQRGNVVLSAHNDVFGETFRDLDQLEPGDAVLVFTPERSHRYVVNRVLIVEPTEVEVLESTQEPTLTLITCYPYMVDTHRVVVIAELAP